MAMNGEANLGMTVNSRRRSWAHQMVARKLALKP
jgi:hypothetical protein